MSVLRVTLVLLAFSALLAAGQKSTSYTAPSSISNADQAYQIGVWSFIVVFLAIVGASYTIGYIDYSGDSMLHVDLSEAKGGHHE